MKVVLYVAQSLDGFIADKDDKVDWISEESWQSYLKYLSLYENLLFGRRTYELLEEDEIDSRKNYYVLTNSDKVAKRTENTSFISDMDSLKISQPLLVCGGSEANMQALKHKLVDEVVIDIENIVLGSGVPLGWTGNEILQLVGSKQIGPQTMHLQFKVSYK